METNQSDSNIEQRKRFIPELSKLPWYLQVLLFLVAIFLIALPYIVMEQKNPFNQAVAVYDKICRMKEAHDVPGIASMIAPGWEGKKSQVKQVVARLKCVDRRNGYKLFIKEDEKKHYILLLRGHGQAIQVRFIMDHDRMMWLPVLPGGG